jgi:ABC-type multidrug transport system permease subunit
MRDREKATQQLEQIQVAWSKSSASTVLIQEIEHETSSPARDIDMTHHSANPLTILSALLHRNFIKSYRDIIAYGIRIAMYVGLAILMGTVWLRLAPHQSNIESFTNSIFYGGAFMSFMAVAYVPAYIEDRNLFVKERQNGLYGPTAFMIANFITGLLPLFIITILFSVLVYWLSNFRPSAEGFWIFVMWLFLDLVAAEGLVVLITNICPIFVVALAAIAFANGLWMSVDGFMVQPHTLNPFWRYVFHYIDYQAYVFQGMMVNEFGKRNYACESLPSGGCQCMYSSPLEGQCEIAGTAVLESYGYRTDRTGVWVGILIVIIAGYRILGWAVMYLKRH